MNANVNSKTVQILRQLGLSRPLVSKACEGIGMICPNDGSLVCKLPERIAELEKEVAELRAKLQGGEGA